jgi:hypothetical protein
MPLNSHRPFVNRHQNDMTLKEIGFYAQNMLPILGLVANIIGGTYVVFLWLIVSGF